MISSIAWVPKGASRERPARYQLSENELAELKALQGDAAEPGADHRDAPPAGGQAEDGLDQYGLPAGLRMDDYDDDGDEAGDAGVERVVDELGAGAMPFVTENDEMLVDEHGMAMTMADLEGDEADDNLIKPDDAVLLAASTHQEEDVSVIEMYVYDNTVGTIYVHHDIAIPTFPLSLSWLGVAPTGAGDAGSYVAVGTFDPVIEIWNLDVLDPMEPSASLGGEGPSSASAARRARQGRTVQRSQDGHEDAVMSVACNLLQRQVLASGSADHTVKLWDVTTQQCSATFRHHADKVQSVVWHPVEAAILATGAFDSTVQIVDARQAGADAIRAPMKADVEDIAWDPHAPTKLVASAEDGSLRCFDVRKPSKALFHVDAHQGPASSVSFSLHVRGLLASCGVDKCVKLWDTEAMAQGSGTALVMEKEMAVGELFACGFHAQAPGLLAAAGSKGIPALWELADEDLISRRFQGRATEEGAQALTAAMDGAEDTVMLSGGAEADEDLAEKDEVIAELAADLREAGDGSEMAMGDSAASAATATKKKKKKKKGKR